MRTASKRATIPGQVDIRARFQRFTAVLPELCQRAGLDRTQLEFADYLKFAQNWLVAQRKAGP